MQALIELIFLGILALRPEWRDDACDHRFSSEVNERSCETRRDLGQAWAREIATSIATETERQNMTAAWDWIVGDIKRESDFERGDVCPIRIPLDNIISRRVINEEADREKICWDFTVHHDMTPLRNCQPVLVDREETDAETGIAYLYVDRCAYGEVGLMQIRSHEARSGQVVPATGEALPRSNEQRRVLLLRADVNISLGLVALANARDMCCCQTVNDVQTCDVECQADPTQFLGAYNTGHCDSDAGDSYIEKVNKNREKAIEYICATNPEAFVGVEGVENQCEVEATDDASTPTTP